MELNAKNKAMRFILLLGVVSLFADITYEGARSATGPFLAVLGAGAATVGLVAGFGEFIGYGLRLVAGYFADKTERYWLFTAFGYAVNLLAVPALALAGNWQFAAALIVMERFGKALRTPARDAMLSYATQKVGRGWGFGIHEAMDQVGAVTGPLIVSAILFFHSNDYRAGFAFLLLPALLALLTLLIARINFPQPSLLEVAGKRDKQPVDKKMPGQFWLYSLFITATVAGFAHFQLISYHFKEQAVLSDVQIPVFFAVAMGVDALVALVIGKVYDRIGLVALTAVPVLTIFIPFLVFTSSYLFALAGIILWGAVMGIQETVLRAAVSDMVPFRRRGFAFGIFNTAFGISWFLGSMVMGILYDISIAYIGVFVVLTQILALVIFNLLRMQVNSSGDR